MERVLSRLTAAKPNPSASELVRGPSTRLWVRLTAPDGGVVERWMTTPNPYRCTADALLAVVQHAASGAIAPGAHTPSQAHGAGFAESLDGVSFDPSRGTSNTTW